MHKTHAEMNPSATIRIYGRLLVWSQFHKSSWINRFQWHAQLCS